MKKIIFVCVALILLALITHGDAVDTGLRTLTVNAPIPDRYIPSMEQSQYVTGITKDQANTYITVNISGLSDPQKDNIRDTYQRIQSYFVGVYSSNLLEMVYFENQPLPFSCPKDIVTGEISGVYLQNGALVVDVGDPGGRCPR